MVFYLICCTFPIVVTGMDLHLVKFAQLLKVFAQVLAIFVIVYFMLAQN